MDSTQVLMVIGPFVFFVGGFVFGYAAGFKEAKQEVEPTYSPEVVRLYGDIQALIKKATHEG
jgi:hypothetical protein